MEESLIDILLEEHRLVHEVGCLERRVDTLEQLCEMDSSDTNHWNRARLDTEYELELAASNLQGIRERICKYVKGADPEWEDD